MEFSETATRGLSAIVAGVALYVAGIMIYITALDLIVRHEVAANAQTIARSVCPALPGCQMLTVEPRFWQNTVNGSGAGQTVVVYRITGLGTSSTASAARAITQNAAAQNGLLGMTLRNAPYSIEFVSSPATPNTGRH